MKPNAHGTPNIADGPASKERAMTTLSLWHALAADDSEAYAEPLGTKEMPVATMSRVCPPYYAYLPSAYADAALAWFGDPMQMADYTRFVRHALWYAGEYARYAPVQLHGVKKSALGFAPPSLVFTNGCIDWESIPDTDTFWTEMALSGLSGGGWVDPDLTTIGSTSWEHHRQIVIQENPCLVTVRRRVFSLITSDATLDPYETDPRRQFYPQVVAPLVRLGRQSRNARQAWLRVMFAFCAGKPFVYYSEHTPDPAIIALAAEHTVPFLHLPLSKLPAEHVANHRTFLFVQLSSPQYLALREHY